MKENSLDSHRGKVADSKVGATAKADPTATNFDDDYNEWELGIGDLIIDLDADIEKNNEKSGVTVVQQTATAFSMSSGKGRANSNAAVEHQATVDKGLKMKIKRTKPTKTSEAKHEIVKSDTKPSSPVETLNGNVGLAATNAVDGKPKHVSSKGRGGSHREKKERTKEKEKSSGSSSSSSSKSVDMNGLLMSSSSAGPTMPTPTIKLTTSNVNMNSITSPTVNLGVPANLVSLNMSTSNSTTYTSNSSGPHSGNTTSQAPMPTLSVKLDSKFSSVPITSTTSSSSTTTPTATVKLEDTVRKLEDSMRSFSMKRMRINVEKSVEKVDRTTSPRPPEMHDMCIGTSVGTITEPECLGPCEPGTSVTLEGIVWHETEGGVLVVNVTWRGKTYVGTLLDCTKHDWAPPRFCESPTSDVEARTPKGRGKRGRSNAATPVDMSNYTETRSSVHSKLRNAGKGRRATNTGFQAPPSPAKSDSTPIVGVKRKGRTPDLELNRELEVRSSKRSRSQSRGTPTNSSTPTEQPNSPVLIECPKPNCKKRYRHINGLRYHQTHAHHGSGSGVEDSLDEQTKDMSSDNEESMQENVSVPHSPGAVADKNLRSSPRPFTGKTPAPPERKASPSSQPNASVPGAGSDTFTQPPSTQPTSDLTTLATVAISDSKGGVKISGVLRFGQSSPNHAGIPPETETANVPTPPAIAAPAVSSPSPLNTSTTVQQGSQRCTTTTTTTTTTTISTITTSPTSQVYQFTHAPIGSLTTTTVSTVRSPSTTTVPVTSNNLTPTTTIGSPPTMATSFNTASVEKPKPKQEKTEKFKLKPPLTVQRPLTQPTGPPPQVIPISPSLPPSQPNVMTPSASPQAAVTHPTLAANIKPIQPKPVVLNDPNALNPSLENIKKEKSKHKKKSKDKERRTGEGSPGQNDGKLQGLEVMDKLNGGVYSKVTEVLTKDGVRELVAPHLQNSAYPMTPVSRTIESPLDVNAGDGSNTANENVQSPAYSDISDANDTAPVLESEVQNKEKEEEKTKAPSEPTPPPASNLGPFSMYYPYRQPPYLMPSVPPQTSVPQTVTPDKPKEGNTEKVDGCIKEQKQWNDRERISGSNTSAETEKKETLGTLSQPANQTNVSDYQLQQQKLLQQQYTYPYGYSYPYQVDPSYHMHLMTSDPHIKQQVEKCMEERDRLYKDLLDRPKDATNKETPEKNKVQVKIEPEKRKSSCSSDVMKAPSQSATSVSSHKEREVHHGQSQSTKLDSSSSNLKEKQNENHQILKENIELKSQMENKSKYERYNQSVLYHPEEARHYYPHIYAEKYLESQKPEEVRRKEENAPPKQPMADTKTQGPAKESIKPPTSVHSSHSSSSPKSNPNPVKELVNKEVPKKEASLTEGSKNADNTEGSSKDKRDAERPKQQEGQKPTMETQGPPPPTSSYAYMHPQFMQSSPYAPISFDHSMYRSMLMTPGAFPGSPYLHPQMRYHVPPNDHQSGHISPKMHSGGSTKALDLLQHHASQYYTSHKIHELQERALKSPPSSLNQSTPTAINKIVDNPLAVKNEPNTPGNSLERRSPPLQRHLHTHHHTHVGVGYPINIAQYDPYGSKPLVRH